MILYPFIFILILIFTNCIFFAICICIFINNLDLLFFFYLDTSYSSSGVEVEKESFFFMTFLGENNTSGEAKIFNFRENFPKFSLKNFSGIFTPYWGSFADCYNINYPPTITSFNHSLERAQGIPIFGTKINLLQESDGASPVWSNYVSHRINTTSSAILEPANPWNVLYVQELWYRKFMGWFMSL
jgi:hypothetical protein